MQQKHLKIRWRKVSRNGRNLSVRRTEGKPFRRGSAVVLLCILFMSISGVLAVIYEAADRKAAICIAEDAFDNAGNSILACYDKELFDRYGLFGFESPEADTEKRIKKIVQESLESSTAAACSVEQVEVEQSAYLLTDPDNMMLQMQEIAGRSAILEGAKLIKDNIGTVGEKVKEKKQAQKKARELEKERDEAKKNAVETAEQERAEAEAAGDTEAAEAASASGTVSEIEEAEKIQNDLKDRTDSISGEPDESGEWGRTLRNGRITENLPSAAAGYSGETAYAGGSVLSDLSSEGVGESISDDVALLAYIKSHFRNRYEEGDSGESFFLCEEEYILYGCYSDEENYKKAYHSIFIIRSSFNIAYLYTDPDKSLMLTSMSEAMTPGMFAPLTRLLLTMLWAAVEAENDMANLENGNGVPLGKDDATWMTDLDGVVSGASSGGYLEIPGNSTMTYGSYLTMLMLTIDRDTKIYRIQDLIQINMKGTVREEFTLLDHYTGLVLKGELSKKSHAVGITNSSAEVNMTHTYLTGE